jgi:hypothetical protein
MLVKVNIWAVPLSISTKEREERKEAQADV